MVLIVSLIYMKYKTNFWLLILILFCATFFKNSKEGLKDKKTEISLGDWKMKVKSPSETEILKAQKNGKKTAPGNLAIMFKEDDDWKTLFTFFPNGTMEGKEFRKI